MTGRLAALAAQTGWAAFHQAIQDWIDDPSQSLDALSATASPAQARPGD